MLRLRNKKRADGRLQAKVYLGVIDGKAKYNMFMRVLRRNLKPRSGM